MWAIPNLAEPNIQEVVLDIPRKSQMMKLNRKEGVGRRAGALCS